MHYGLLPRANRGIFAINELPDLAGKIQVGLFNIMQEGDVQIKGYPVRLPLDLMLVFTANPEDYTARGKIITPLKDRIGSEIRTHYPATLEHGIAITRAGSVDGPRSRRWKCACPTTCAKSSSSWRFLAREDKRVDKRSGVSQRLPISVTGKRGLECRAARARERRRQWPCRACSIIYAALPAITGKLELEYEGELKGGDAVARELIRAAVGKVYNRYFEGVNMQQIVQWFDLGGTLKLDEDVDSADDGAAARRHSGPDGEDSKRLGLDRERAGCGARVGGGIHSGRTVRAPAHQPHRRARLRRRRAKAPRAAGAGREAKGERPNFRRQYN